MYIPEEGREQGLTAAVGHCFPVFAGFHGGKAVATMYGFLFGMMLIGPYADDERADRLHCADRLAAPGESAPHYEA